MIKIVSPITSIREVDPLIDAGVSEFYCGVMTERENKSLTNIYCLNRRPSLFSNLTSFKELAGLVQKAGRKKAKVSFTLNEFYAETQFISVMEQAKRAMDCGIDAFIVADIGLIERLRCYEDKIRIHIGVGGTVFNSHAVSFYKKMGAARIILPRQLTLSEISEIRSKTRDMELECLILNERCHFIDGFCSYVHSLFSYKSSPLNFLNYNRFKDKISRFLPDAVVKTIHKYGMKKELACCFDYGIKTRDSSGILTGRYDSALSNFFNAETFLNACGACALYELNKSGIDSVKIVGRVFFKNKVKDAEFIRTCLLLSQRGIDFPDYADAVRGAYRKYYNKRCRKSYCYYPY